MTPTGPKRSVLERNPRRVCFTVSCLIAALSLSWPHAAWAHEDQEFHLAGARFCVDSASVQVALELPDPARARAAEESLHEGLAAALSATLARNEVAYQRGSCKRAREYALLSAEVRYLDPETYLGFGDSAYTYTLALQVGRFADKQPLKGIEHMLNSSYDAFASDIHSEVEAGGPFEPHVVREGEKLVQNLATYW